MLISLAFAVDDDDDDDDGGGDDDDDDDDGVFDREEGGRGPCCRLCLCSCWCDF